MKRRGAGAVFLPVVTGALAVEYGFVVHLIGYLVIFSRYGCGKDPIVHRDALATLSIAAVAGAIWLASWLARRVHAPVLPSMAIAITLIVVLASPYIRLFSAVVSSLGWDCGD